MFNNPYMSYTPSNLTQRNGITWVQGIEGAKAFQLLPNSNIILMDSENDGKFYIKVCDGAGMCNLRTFNYVEVVDKPSPQVDMGQYVTRDELVHAINELKGVMLDGKQSVQSTKRQSTT